MARFVFIIAILLMAWSAKGQLVQSELDKTTDSLKRKGVNTFILFSKSCIGCRPGIKPCEFYLHLFWKDNTKSYYKKFSDCNTFAVTEILTRSPVDFYVLYKDSIDAEEIKKRSVYEVIGKDTIGTTSTNMHGSFYHLTSNIGGIVKTKTVFAVDVDSREFNQKTKTTEWLGIINSVIK